MFAHLLLAENEPQCLGFWWISRVCARPTAVDEQGGCLCFGMRDEPQHWAGLGSSSAVLGEGGKRWKPLSLGALVFHSWGPVTWAVASLSCSSTHLLFGCRGFPLMLCPLSRLKGETKLGLGEKTLGCFS